MSTRSVTSKASNASSKMLEELASRSNAKIFRAEGSFNDEEMRVIWNALGLYINRNLRMGRGVNVPRLGIFTFTPPEVRLKGVTNEAERDQKPRTPVFLIQKDFVKGMNLKTSIFYHQQFGMGLRPYAVFGSNGDVPITKMNMAQISSYANMSKDATQIALNRIIKYLGQKVIQGSNLNFEIPSVGSIISKGSLIAVRFNEHIHRQTRTILSQSVDVRKQRGLMNLTSDNLKNLANASNMSMKLANKSNQFFQIDDGAKKYLNQTFGLYMNQSNMKRTMTNFDRSFATRPFNQPNSDLKNSQIMRMSLSGMSFNQKKNLNRQYNFALKIVKEWVYKNCISTQKSFTDFRKLANTSKQILNADDVWAACKSISSDITQQQSQQLFRFLDFNKDGYVTQDDWNRNINFDSNKLLKQFVKSLKQKNYTISSILKQMNLEGVKSVSVYNLKQALQKVSQSLSDDNALFLSRYICKGNVQTPIQNLIDILNITSIDQQRNQVDRQWEDKFLGRIKRKMNDELIFQQEFLNKFRFYDSKATGFIDQTEFKNVLAEVGVGITLNQLLKIVKLYPINKHNQINYQRFFQKLQVSNAADKQTQLSSDLFNKLFAQNYSQGKIKLPISIIQLTSLLQSKILKDYSQKSIMPLVKKLDINGDGIISGEDMKYFKQENKQSDFSELQQAKIHQLFLRLKQKSIKKRISFPDIFKKIDSHSNGFITRQQWQLNLDKMIIFSQNQKQNMFNLMNKTKSLGMVDYKTFLMFVNTQANNRVEVFEKFDWVEKLLDSIKQWYSTSKLTLEDAYRLIDKDADTYLNQKDITTFLLHQLKVPPRQTNLVRIQKLIKVLDSFKKGKLNFLDWKTFIEKNKSDWIQDAKQQIGIVLSRTYPNLEQAFTTITQGDRKLLFNVFEKWIKANKVLSGFMTNDDILKHLYSSLDAHKKGYLLQSDFTSSFNSYHWKVQHIKQFICQLQTKFPSSLDAYKCLTSYKNQILTEQLFYESTKSIFQQRFTKSDLKAIWVQVSAGRTQLSLEQWNLKYGDEWNGKQDPVETTYPKDNWLYRDFQIIKGTTIRSKQFNYAENQKMEHQAVKILENVKDILATSPKSLEQVFKEVDKSNTGKITNLQFKKAFRILNIALTAKQIDLLLNYCNFKIDTLIDWKDFVKKINLRQEKKLIFERMLPKVQHLSDLFHFYMVSPKDAFRKSNNPRTGYMQFQQFYKLVKNVYEQASQALPEFQIIRQLFQYIDVRKDNQIDFQEFTQIFRNCKPPSLLMGTTPANDQDQIAKMMKNSQQSMPIRQQSVPLFKNSSNYEELVNLIGRNRRFIQTQIQKICTDPLVPFGLIQTIVKDFCAQQGLKLEENITRNLMAFSMTGQKVDYKLMLNDFKQRSQSISCHPKKNFF